MNLSRRDWILRSVALGSLPEILSAQQHAHDAVRSPAPTAFTYLSEQAAREIEAITSQIIPSGDGPGAREAGVIYFIDRALATFAQDQQEMYRKGLDELQATRQSLFPGSATIAALTTARQIELTRSIEKSEFFELLRTHTVLGFLGNPSYGGNRGLVGWKHIGFEDRMIFEPPFGYYDAEERGK